jgi:hypothetical protein
MNIEHLTRKKYLVKLGLKSTGYFDFTHGKDIHNLHAVKGDQINVWCNIVWGSNRFTISAKDTAVRIDFIRLASEPPVTNWEGKNLLIIAENKIIRKNTERTFWFTYPVGLDPDFIKLNKNNQLYYE